MPRRSEACVICDRRFEAGDTFLAYLYETDQGYERRDCCRDCKPVDHETAVGCWKARRPEPVARKVQQFDREAIYAFFRRLDDADTPEKLQFRFVLALLLWRKKVLKFDRTEQSDDGEIWRFVVPRTGESHAVLHPDLDEAQIESLSSQLEGLLEGAVGDADAVWSSSDGGVSDD